VVSGSYCSAEAWLLGSLHDRAGHESSLIAASAALIGFEPAAINEAMFMASAAWTAEPYRPASFLQGSLTLLLAAVEPLEFRHGEAFLELDRAACHILTGICVPHDSPGVLCAERAG
jgi:hypothetical protein